MGFRMQFTGDILCQIPQTEACRTENGYNYTPILAHVSTYLQDCDYLVGNLETPIAGEELGFSDKLYQFNTPDEFLSMLKDAGFNFLSTANNHCMDRGIEGLKRTLDKLDEFHFQHAGTYRSAEERNTPHQVTLGGIKFGFLSYTYGTNAFFHHTYIPEDEPWAVNMFQPEEELPGAINLLDEKNIASRVEELYKQPNSLFDKYIHHRLEQMKQDIAALKDTGAEYTIMLLHCGGQHNLMPDAYTRWIVDYLCGCGVDLIIGNHQHILHPYVRIGNTRTAYCLGNLTDTPNSNPNGQGIGEEYSILLRMDFEKHQSGPFVKSVSFVPVKSVFDDQNRAVVRSVSELIRESTSAEEKEQLEKDLRHFVNLVRNTTGEVPVCEEYQLE